MKTVFSKKDLISFGEYLLSDERAALVIKNSQSVNHADVENWKEKAKRDVREKI